MATPFASGYAPINLLNDSIQAQSARGQQGYLDAQKINEAAISDALNRAVQQRALQQQAAAQQQHYGLQQQQLANDVAYRNAVLGQGGQQQAEAKRQFDAKLALDQAIANANIKQMDRPGYGLGKDFGPMLLQGSQDAAAHNAAATAIASQATSALNSARQAYDAEVKQIKDPAWYQSVWRHLPAPTATQQDLLNSAKAKFDATYSKILSELGPHRDKVSFVGTPDENGKFEPVLLTAPTMPGVSPRATEVPTPQPDLGIYPAGYGVPQGEVPKTQPTPFSNWNQAPVKRGSYSTFNPPVAAPQGVAPGVNNRLYLGRDGKFYATPQ